MILLDPTWEAGNGCARDDVLLHNSTNIRNKTLTYKLQKEKL